MDTDALLQKLKSELKLKSSKTGGAFGVIKRIPLHIFQPDDPNATQVECVRVVMSIASAQAGSNAVKKLREKSLLKSARLTDSETLTTQGATIQLKLNADQLNKLNMDQFLKLISETALLVSKVPQAVPWPAPGAKLVLLDGVVPTHLVVDEAGNVESNQTGMFPLGRAPANVVLAATYGLAAMFVGHFLWAYIYGFVNTSSLFRDNVAFILYVLAAVWFGALIGWPTVKGAGRLTTTVSLLVALFSIIGIFCGQTLGYALIYQYKSGVFDFKSSTDVYVENLLTFDMGSLVGLVFPMIGALFGAFLATGLSGNTTEKSNIEFAESGVHRTAVPAEGTTASV